MVDSQPEPRLFRDILCFEFLGRQGDFVELRCLECGYVFLIDPKQAKDPLWQRAYSTMNMCPKCRTGVSNAERKPMDH